MENLKAAVPFISLGVVCGWLGFAIGGFLGSVFIGIGLNWFVVGVIFALADREVSTEGFLAGFFFGILGSVIWLLLSLSREKTSCPPEYRSWKGYQKAVHQGDYRCGTCFWFGKAGCKRNEEYINGEPCEDYERQYRYY